MDEIDIARWAAGAKDEIDFQDKRIDYDKLFAILKHQALFHRFLNRGPEVELYFPSDFIQRVQCMCDLILTRLCKQIDQLNELSLEASLLSGGDRVIPIKGVAVYALTGDQSIARHSNDIDVFHGDCDSLRLAASKLGYACRETGAAYSHSAIMRDEIEIEIHKYFPLMSYPVEFESLFTGGRLQDAKWLWTESPCIVKRHITYSDLLAHSCHAALPNAQDIVVPNVNMSVMIMCAHVFADYIRGGANLRGIVKLAELADIRDLVRNEQFDHQSFLTLTEEFGGGDAARLTATLVHRLLGCDTFLKVLMPIVPLTELPPQRLMKSIGIWTRPSKPNGLIERDMASIVDYLGGTNVYASSTRQPLEYSTSSKDVRHRLGTVIRHPMPADPIHIRLSVEWTEDILRFHIFVTGDPNEDSLVFNFGYNCPTWLFTGLTLQKIESMPQYFTLTRSSGPNYYLDVRLPWCEMPKLSPHSHGLEMLFGVVRSQFWLSTVIIPITIRNLDALGSKSHCS